jgi:hypothetical protein
MRAILLLFCLITFISCSEDFRKITTISEISGLWEGEKGSLLIDTGDANGTNGYAYQNTSRSFANIIIMIMQSLLYS